MWPSWRRRRSSRTSPGFCGPALETQVLAAGGSAGDPRLRAVVLDVAASGFQYRYRGVPRCRGA
eukprot:1116104-Lingulodinium_polyedra.AAC.1